MRKALETALGRNPHADTAHPGLLYERYVPLAFSQRSSGQSSTQGGDFGQIRHVSDRDALLDHVAAIPVGAIYRRAFARWAAALTASGASVAIVKATSRLLLGHGNPAPSEVGLSLHHVYGVPVLNGSSLKGLLNHYLASWGAADDPEWRGPQEGLDGAPGAYHGALFGVPNRPLGDGLEQQGQAGGVIFEDAWLVPEGDAQKPLCADVVTPHQMEYYRNAGAKPPNDWTDPTPVTFLTVKPETRFLLAVSPGSAGKEGADLALAHLLDALREWGVGGKTRAGYGRLALAGDAAALPAASAEARSAAPPKPVELTPALLALETAVAAVVEPPQREPGPPIAERLATHVTDAALDALSPEERVRAKPILQRLMRHAGLKKRCAERLAQLMAKVEP